MSSRPRASGPRVSSITQAAARRRTHFREVDFGDPDAEGPLPCATSGVDKRRCTMRDGKAGAFCLGLTGVTALAAALLWATPSEAGWDGSQEVRLGDQITAEFRDAPLLEVHDYTFWAPKGTVLSA